MNPRFSTALLSTALLATFSMTVPAQTGLNCTPNLVSNHDFSQFPPFFPGWTTAGPIATAGVQQFDVDNDGIASDCFFLRTANGTASVTQSVGQLEAGTTYEFRANLATTPVCCNGLGPRVVSVHLIASSGNSTQLLAIGTAILGSATDRYPLTTSHEVTSTGNYDLVIQFSDSAGGSLYRIDDVELLAHPSMPAPVFGMNAVVRVGATPGYFVRAQPNALYAVLIGFGATLPCSGLQIPNITGDFLLQNSALLVPAGQPSVMNPTGLVTGSLPIPNSPSLAGLTFFTQPASIDFPQVAIGFVRSYHL